MGKPALTRRPWHTQPPHGTPFKPGVIAAYTPHGGQFDSAHGRPTAITTSTQYEVGAGAGGDWRASTWYQGYRAVNTVNYGASYPLMILAVGSNLTAQTNNLVHICTGPDASANWPMGIRMSAGQIIGETRVAGGAVDKTIAGPTVAAADLAIIALVWEPGIGMSLSVNGIDYGTTSFTDAALYRDATWFEEAQVLNGRLYLTAWLDPGWIPLRNELSANPWQIFQDQRILVPVLSAGGGSHTLTGANSGQANTSSTGAIAQTHALVGASASLAGASSAGAITQTHALAASSAAIAASSSSGTIGQTHALAGSNAAQSSASSAGTITQAHALTGAAASQASTSSAAAIGQAHTLAASNAAIASTSGTGAVSLGGAIVLAAADAAIAASSAGGEISQAHALAGASAALPAASSTGSIAQSHALTASNSSLASTSSAAAIVLGGTIVLAGADAAMASASSAGAIGQAHVLVGAGAVLGRTSSAGALVGASAQRIARIEFSMARRAATFGALRARSAETRFAARSATITQR